MRRLLSLLTITLVFISYSTSCFAGDFRESNWGASKEEVKAKEKSKFEGEKEGVLGYSDNVSNLPVFVIYRFVDNKLVSGTYKFRVQHTNKNDYISDYNSIKKALSGKYGEPSKDNTYWKNELYKEKFEKWGFAVSLGHLSYFTGWNDDDTTILSALYGDNYKITFSIDYTTEIKELKALVEEQKNQQKANKL